jgi:hypothetical protein
VKADTEDAIEADTEAAIVLIAIMSCFLLERWDGPFRAGCMLNRLTCCFKAAAIPTWSDIRKCSAGMTGCLFITAGRRISEGQHEHQAQSVSESWEVEYSFLAPRRKRARRIPYSRSK